MTRGNKMCVFQNSHDTDDFAPLCNDFFLRAHERDI